MGELGERLQHQDPHCHPAWDGIQHLLPAGEGHQGME